MRPFAQEVLSRIGPEDMPATDMELVADLFVERGGRWEDVAAGSPGAIAELKRALADSRGKERKMNVLRAAAKDLRKTAGESSFGYAESMLESLADKKLAQELNGLVLMSVRPPAMIPMDSVETRVQNLIDVIERRSGNLVKALKDGLDGMKEAHEKFMAQGEDRAEKLKARAKKIVESAGRDYEFKEYKGYSGRGMFGKESPFAFTTDMPRRSPEGKQLEALGFMVDSLGLDTIYYLR